MLATSETSSWNLLNKCVIKPFPLTTGTSPAQSKLHDCKDVRGFLSQCCSTNTWATELHISDAHRPLWDSNNDIRFADGNLSSAQNSTTFTRIFAWSSLQRAQTCCGCGQRPPQPLAAPSANLINSRTHSTTRKNVTAERNDNASQPACFPSGRLHQWNFFSSQTTLKFQALENAQLSELVLLCRIEIARCSVSRTSNSSVLAASHSMAPLWKQCSQ